MTLTEAQQSGRPLLVNTRPMTRVGRAVEKNETQGFMKLIADAETQRILGAAILGMNGDEAIHGVLDLMNADQPYTTLAMGGADSSHRIGAAADAGQWSCSRCPADEVGEVVDARRHGSEQSAR